MSARTAAVTRRRRAVLYLRQSTFREESISLELQEAAGRDYCTRQGYDVVGVEADPGISGRTWKRPAVQRVMGMIEAGEADVVVLWKWSRLSRSRKDWALAIDRADVAGGSIESATEPLDTATASGRFARGLMTEYAAFQSEQIGEQWKEAHARRRRLGLPADGGPRFGYVKRDGFYHPEPSEAPLLAEFYRRYLSGQGFTAIVRWANANGHTTRAGNPWSRIVMTHLLDSGFGAGLIIHRPTGRDGKRDWNIARATFHPGQHPAVITPSEWDAYRARRADTPPPRVVEGKYMLTGLIVCGDCGAPMHVGNAGLKDYKCSRAAQSGGTVRGMYMTRALVEQRVREWVQEEAAAAIDEEAARQARATRRPIVPIDNVTTLERKIADVRERMGRITVRWSAGKMPDDAYDAAIAQLDADLDVLHSRLRAAAPATAPADLRKIAFQLASAWDNLLVDERRRLLRALIYQVRINKPARQGTGVWRERVDIIPTWDAPAVG